MVAHLSLFFTLGIRNALKSPVNNTYEPLRLLLHTSNAISPKLSAELWPIISDNDKDDSPQKLGEDRMPPKMRKQWMHRGVGAMEEAVAGH